MDDSAIDEDGAPHVPADILWVLFTLCDHLGMEKAAISHSWTGRLGPRHLNKKKTKFPFDLSRLSESNR